MNNLVVYLSLLSQPEQSILQENSLDACAVI